MKTLITIACASVCAFAALDANAWGNKEKKQAKAEAKAAKKAEKQKEGIKNWQKSRFMHDEVAAIVAKNGCLTNSDINVECNVEEMRAVMDMLFAGYVTVVNILDGYIDHEEGNAIAGLVAKKVEGGKTMEVAIAELSESDKKAYDEYAAWLKNGDSTGKLRITDEDIAKIRAAAEGSKERIAEVKEKVKGRKGVGKALLKDTITVGKMSGSIIKGCLMLKGVSDREKAAKKMLGL